MSCKTTIVVLAHILSSQDVILHSMFFLCLLNCLLVMVFFLFQQVVTSLQMTSCNKTFFTSLLQPDESHLVNSRYELN